MPCTDCGVPYPDHKYEDMQERLDNMARFVCGMLRIIEDTQPTLYYKLIENDPKLEEWWKDHKAHDARHGR